MYAMKPKVVFHIDSDNGHRLQITFNAIRNVLKEAPPKQASIFVVADGDSVALFTKDRGGAFVRDFEELQKSGIRFLVCEEAATGLALSKDDLVEQCSLIKSGIWELIRLQHEGYAYVKP
jgi:uncharacterized protein